MADFLGIDDHWPPRDAAEILAYDPDDVFRGYTEHAASRTSLALTTPPPVAGERSTARRDRSGRPDGYDHLRHAVLAAIRTPGKLK